MVSGVGPATTLKRFNIFLVADRPGVGQNLWDHVLFGPSYRVNVQTSSALSMGNGLALATQEFQEQQDGLLASPGGDFIGYEKVPASLRHNFSRQALQDLDEFPLDWPVCYIIYSFLLPVQLETMFTGGLTISVRAGAVVLLGGWLLRLPRESSDWCPEG